MNTTKQTLWVVVWCIIASLMVYLADSSDDEAEIAQQYEATNEPDWTDW